MSLRRTPNPKGWNTTASDQEVRIHGPARKKRIEGREVLTRDEYVVSEGQIPKEERSIRDLGDLAQEYEEILNNRGRDAFDYLTEFSLEEEGERVLGEIVHGISVYEEASYPDCERHSF